MIPFTVFYVVSLLVEEEEEEEVDDDDAVIEWYLQLCAIKDGKLSS